MFSIWRGCSKRGRQASFCAMLLRAVICIVRSVRFSRTSAASAAGVAGSQRWPDFNSHHRCRLFRDRRRWSVAERDWCSLSARIHAPSEGIKFRAVRFFLGRGRAATCASLPTSASTSAKTFSVVVAACINGSILFENQAVWNFVVDAIVYLSILSFTSQLSRFYCDK